MAIKAPHMCLKIETILDRVVPIHNWTLAASDGAGGHSFGESVAIDGDTIVVGATFAPGETTFTGAAYVYKINEDGSGSISSISPVTKLKASGGKPDDLFGFLIAVRGNFILVGATAVETNGPTTFNDAGAAYLFAFLSKDSNPPQWTQISKFQPNDLIDDASFGRSVAMDESIAVLGDSAAFTAYVFAPVDPTSLSSAWTEMTKLTGPTNSNFGTSVAVAGNCIVVGANEDDNLRGTNAGAVFVFSKTSSSLSSSWSQMNQLLAANGVDGDSFGRSVAISKDASTIVVGADLVDSSDGKTSSGAAYIFQAVDSSKTSKTTKEWTQTGKFLATEQATGDGLGTSIALENNTAVVSAGGDDSFKGSVYVFRTVPDPSKKFPKKSMCFSPVNTVYVKGKGSIPMHELQVGDFVKTADNPEQSHSRVLSFMHTKHDVEVEYLQIFMKHMKVPLEVSPNHLLLIQETNMNVVRAQDVKIGDVLLAGNKVTRISTIQRRGLYAPVTETGTIWVSGVTASCYVDVLSSVVPTLQARLSHAALTPLRIMCAWKFSFCENKTYSVDGYSSHLWMIARVGLQVSTWNGVLQWLVVVLFVPVLVGMSMMEMLFVTKSLLSVATGFVAGGLLWFYDFKMNKKAI
jgi:hypothetical protein